MENIKNFFKGKYQDVGYIGILFVLFIIFALYIGHIYGDLYMDCGREAILPEMILKGKILYKDIFGMYNPFSYQINAFLYLIFGSSLNTLYGAAYINAFLIVIGFYFICKRFISGYYSFSITFFLMCIYIFGSTSLMSYLYPYSFGFTYAACALTYAVLTFLIYMDKGDYKCACLSGLLTGYSIAFKPEFIFCVMPMLIVMGDRKENLKTFLSFIFLFIFPTLYSYTALFIQGFTFNDLLNYISFSRDFFLTSEQLNYTMSYLATEINQYSIAYVLKEFVMFVAICTVIIGYLYLFKKNKYYKIFAIAIIPAFIPWLYNLIADKNYINYFSSITLAVVAVIYVIGDKLKTNENKMLMFLAICGLLSMTRINFMPISKYSIGIYMLLPILAVWIYFIKTEFKIIKNINYKLYITLAFIIIGVFYIQITKNSAENFVKLDTAKGVIIQPQTEAVMFDKIVKWVNEKTDTNESVLVLPEGIMVNYLTGRPTKDKYYHLIPNHISAMGEKNIVKGLNKDKPDYIIIHSAKYPMYGHTEMCTDFGLNICTWVKKNYKQIRRLQSNNMTIKPFEARIYKLK